MDIYDYGIFAGIGEGASIVSLVLIVLMLAAWWKLFEKAGEAGWKALIPIYDLFIIFKIAWGNGWLFLLLLVPVVNIVVGFITNWKFCRAYGKGVGFFIGILFLPNIFLLIMAFDSSEYLGPQ